MAAKKDEPGLRVLQLNAENIKRLVAVEIKPDGEGGLVIIGGNNGAGKSSVIDSIMYALGGKKATKDAPKVLRDGAEEGSVRVDLGELVVTRKWKASGTDTLEVTTRDGHKLSEKQSLLDTLVGPLSFDPLSFASMKGPEQRATLLSLIDLPFDLTEIDRERDGIYTERTDTNRQLKSAKAIVEGLTGELGDAPEEPVDLEAVLLERERAQNRGLGLDAARSTVGAAERMVKQTEGDLAEAERELTAALAKRKRYVEVVAQVQQELAEAQSGVREAEQACAADDFGALDAAVVAARRSQSLAGKVAERDRMREQAESLARDSETLTTALETIDKRKAEGLAAAKMPVDGLGFDSDGVTYNGIPLSQASGAETLRVSIAIAMAKNPTARIILSRDGSLLDADNLAVLREATEGRGVQLWLERVGDADSGAIIIEAGEVRS